jgi:hypothetical protein
MRRRFRSEISLRRRLALDKLGQISDNPAQIDGTETEMNLERPNFLGVSGATRRIRTDDLLITNLGLGSPAISALIR